MLELVKTNTKDINSANKTFKKTVSNNAFPQMKLSNTRNRNSVSQENIKKSILMTIKK